MPKEIKTRRGNNARIVLAGLQTFLSIPLLDLRLVKKPCLLRSAFKIANMLAVSNVSMEWDNV